MCCYVVGVMVCCVLMQVLIMRNFGILVGGICVEDAFHSADSVMTACETQVSHVTGDYCIKLVTDTDCITVMLT